PPLCASALSLHDALPILGRHFQDKDEVVAFLRATLERVGRDLACFAGFEIALLDVAGQVFDFPLGAVLGATAGEELPAGVVIGLDRKSTRLNSSHQIISY